MPEASVESKADPSIPAREFTVLDWFGVVIAAGGGLLLAAFPFTVAPAFGRMYRDMGGALPDVTTVVLSRGPVLALAGLCLLLVAAGVWPRASLARRRALVVAGFVAFMSSAAFLVYGLYAPIFNLAWAIK
jgi:type II secretory pathway component PulF